MSALQLHYTSCRRGQTGSAGFQVRNLTPGVTAGEQREIERRGLYRPPRDANPEPSEQEIVGDLPRALRYATLESGRRILTMSSYCGRDYSGRWGNFFAHTLILDSRDPHMWPIDFYEWDQWQTRLAPEDDTEEAPPPLPEVSLDDIQPAESFTISELSAFINEVPERQHLLAQMLRAVMLDPGSCRPLVVRDTHINGLYWIACIQKLLPLPHALSLSYSTYQSDPRGCAAVNATTGETDFRFDESERTYQLYSFDLTTGNHSAVPESETDYPALVSAWLAEAPDRLPRFFAHMQLFDHSTPDGGELRAAADIFELAEGGLQALGGEHLSAMITFAANHATAEGRVRLMETLAESIAGVSELLQSPEDYAWVISFLADGAAGSSSARHREIALSAWLALVDKQVIGEGTGSAVAKDSLHHLRKVLPGFEKELAGAFLAGEHWQSIEPQIVTLPIEPLLFVLWWTLEALRLSGEVPASVQPQSKVVTTALITKAENLEELASTLLGVVRGDRQELVAMVHTLIGSAMAQCPPAEAAATKRTVGRALGRILAETSSELAVATRGQLDTEESREILFGEWLRLCETATDTRQAFSTYDAKVLAMLPGYDQHYRVRVASSLLDQLKPDDRCQQALDWAVRGELKSFAKELQIRCVELINKTVPLDQRAAGAKDRARLVSEWARRLKLHLKPDRPALQQAIAAAGKGLTAHQLKALPTALTDLGHDDYCFFVESFLVPALTRAENSGEHQRILTAVWNPSQLKVIRKSYGKLFKIRKKRWPEAFHGALRFWLCFDASSQELKELSLLQTDARKGLLSALAGLSEKRLAKVDERLRRARLSDQELYTWQRYKTELAARKQGWLARLKLAVLGHESKPIGSTRKEKEHG